jgi:hypothetical protein
MAVLAAGDASASFTASNAGPILACVEMFFVLRFDCGGGLFAKARRDSNKLCFSVFAVKWDPGWYARRWLKSWALLDNSLSRLTKAGGHQPGRVR